MGRESSMHGGRTKCTAFSGLNPKESECVQESKILKRILNIQDGKAWMGSPGPKRGRLASYCEHSMNDWFQNYVGNFFTDAISFSRTLLPVIDTVACGLRLYVFEKENNTQSRCLEVRTYVQS